MTIQQFDDQTPADGKQELNGLNMRGSCLGDRSGQ